jgi:hypothetical protein
MKRMLSAILKGLALIGLAYPSVVNAAPGWTTPSSAASAITAETWLTVILPAANNPMSCGTATWYRLPSSAPNYQVIVANILSAAAQGKKIQVWASSCDTDGASIITAAWTTL